jgi:hypothetical protein
MAEAGEIDKLWRDFHIALKSARDKTVCYFSKRVARCPLGLIIALILVYLGMSADLLHLHRITAAALPATSTMIPHFPTSTAVAPLYISGTLRFVYLRSGIRADQCVSKHMA